MYRRARAAGHSFFFTLALRNREADTLTVHVDLLRHAFRRTLAERPCRVDAVVVLPDHLHVLWTLPENDTDYSGRWRAIKSLFVRGLRARGIPVHANAKGETDIWQRRFWEHLIRDEDDFNNHIDYIHINPLKHGLVTRVAEWPWSSFHRFVRAGTLSADWAIASPDGSYGE